MLNLLSVKFSGMVKFNVLHSYTQLRIIGLRRQVHQIRCLNHTKLFPVKTFVTFNSYERCSYFISIGDSGGAAEP